VDLKTTARIVAAALLLGLSCLAPVARAQPAPPVDPAALPAAPAPPKVDDPLLVAPPAAPRELSSWSEAVSLSRARSTDLASAYAEVRRAEGLTRTALAALLPTVNGTLSYPHQFITKDTVVLGSPGDPQRTVTSPQSDYLNGNVTLTQSVVNLQAWHTLGTARESEKAARLTSEEITRGITLGVATAVLGVVASERVAELNRIGLRTSLERRELTSRKRALGVATGLDVLRADQDVSSARSAVVSGDEALRKAREALGLALGVPEQVGVSRGIAIDAVAAEAERTCPAIGGVAERSDYLAAQKKLAIAERTLGNIERAFLPTLNAQSTLASTTADLGNATPRTTWNVTAVLSVPIWDGGAKYGALGSARAVRDQSSFQLESVRRGATIESAQARRGITVAEASLEVARQAEKQAAEVDRLTQAGYRAGQGTSLELVVAASALRAAQITLALREFDVVNARLQALFALARCPGAR
jgi:outer membrane protein TolC